ncbi:hypothetical protein ACS0TY_021215 [Phlomoides rotata]
MKLPPKIREGNFLRLISVLSMSFNRFIFLFSKVVSPSPLRVHRYHSSVVKQMTGKRLNGENRGGRVSSRPSLSASLATSQDHEPSFELSTASVAASSAEKEARPELHVVGNSILPSHQTTAVLRSIFSSLIECDGTSWMEVSDGTKKFYHEEFHKRCKWDPAINDSIEALYSEKAASCYRDMIHDWLDNWSDNHEKPECVSNDTWNIFLDHWNDTQVQKDTAQEKATTCSQPTEDCTEPQPIQTNEVYVETAKDRVFSSRKRSYSSANDSSTATSPINDRELNRLVEERVIQAYKEDRAKVAAEQQALLDMKAKMERLMNTMCSMMTFIGAGHGTDVAAIMHAITDTDVDAEAIGHVSKATDADVGVIRHVSKATDADVEAIGHLTKATNADVEAFGHVAKATDADMEAMGPATKATDALVEAIEHVSKATGADVEVIGHVTRATDAFATKVADVEAV